MNTGDEENDSLVPVTHTTTIIRNRPFRGKKDG
jgi:hypothetical protein